MNELGKGDEIIKNQIRLLLIVNKILIRDLDTRPFDDNLVNCHWIHQI